MALALLGLAGGHWVAQRLDASDRDAVARSTVAALKQGAPPAPGPPAAGQSGPRQEPRYASIDELPGLPRYTDNEPGRQRATLEENATSRPAAPPRATASDAWRRNAVPFADDGRRPLIAIVIDDMGLDRARSAQAAQLPAPLTLSWLPYARDLREQARAARARGHELMLHLPMEPAAAAHDPGPGALFVSMPADEIQRRTVAALGSFDGYVGVNNHMGSRFTAHRPGMETALRAIRERGLLFLDSRTDPRSLGDSLAGELGLPAAVRHVFLDDVLVPEAVRAQLAETERLARRQGFVVAIGHPHDVTIAALAAWLPTLAEKGLAQAPLTALVRRRGRWE